MVRGNVEEGISADAEAAGEIEVTQEMTEAGKRVLDCWCD